jgi:hypothetical protein
MPGAALPLIVILPLIVEVGSFGGAVCARANTAALKIMRMQAIAWRVEDTISESRLSRERANHSAKPLLLSLCNYGAD